MKGLLLAALLASLPASDAFAQFPSLRTTDTRTSVPEAVMAERKDWGADLNFGGAFNRGNTDVNYINSGFDAFKAWAPNTAYLSGSMIYNTFGGNKVLNMGRLTARCDHPVAGPWKVFAFHTDAYNHFTRLNLRDTTGAGPWVDLPLGASTNGLSLAVVHEYESFKTGVVNRSAKLSLRDISRLPISEVADVSADLFYIQKADEAGAYRLSAELALTSIFWRKNLGLKVSCVDEYDNHPQPGVKKNDTLWQTSLTLRFGR